MKNKLLCALAVLVLAATCSAQNANYKQVAKWVIGGDGGWDYITYDAESNRLFIGHNSAIYVVDAGTGKKLGEVPATGAHGATIVPEKGLGFSSNGKAGTVTVFDAKTLAPKTDIKTGENPDFIMYDKYTKKVLVMNGRSKDLAVIDPDSLKITETVPLGGKLEAAVTDSGHVYVNIEDTAEIAVVDSKDWKATQRWKIADCEEPTGLALDETNGRLFSVCHNNKMAVVDTKTGKTIASLPTGSGSDGAVFDSAMKLAFSSNGDGTLTVVREGNGGRFEVAANVSTEHGARTIALDPKTNRVFLPTAEFGPPAEGQKRPSVKPGTFMVLVYAPENK